jgi:recA bacterial DNA recombination protein
MSLSVICPQFELDHLPFASKKLPQMERFSALSKVAGVIPASRLEVRPTPEMVSSGIRELDLLTGGLPRGCLTEVYGPASSGRTSLLLSVLAASTKRSEVCALVDVSDALDPVSAHGAGVIFENLLWVRCGSSPPKKSFAAKNNYAKKKELSDRQTEGPVEQALRVTDLLLQSGGFGLVVFDLGDVSVKVARRIPLTSWFRFQRVVENTPTVLFVIASVPCAPTCASLLMKLRASGKRLSAVSSQLSDEHQIPTHSLLLDGLQVEGELLRSRMERKPVQSVTRFATRTVRAG